MGYFMKTNKAKFLMEAVIVTAIALAFIMPSGAVLTTADNEIQLPEGTELQNIIDSKQQDLFKENIETLAAGDDVWITPYIGDDYMPAITVDGSNNHIIVWTNEETFTTSYQGITYTNTPTDEASWIAEGHSFVYAWSMENPVAWDIGYITGEVYTGLAGCAFDYATLAQVGYKFTDVTDLDNTLEAWTWSGENPGFVSCESVDQPNHAGSYAPDLIGYSEGWITHFIEQGYDIPGCPAILRTDPVGSSGQSSFDAQEGEKTAPAGAYDLFVQNPEFIHHVMSNEETGKIIWKMTEQNVEEDIEYTQYQSTIADGKEGQIAGNAETILITYIDGSSVKAIYSTDNGETWNTATIGTGNHANVCEANGVFYAVFTNENNLFLSSSEDGGATWSTPTQVNDVDGTVVAEHKYFDVHKGGIVWTDERNEDWDVYYQSLETGPTPVLTIDSVSGGFGVSATINNVGTADATNVQWTIAADGTVFVGGEKSGSIGSIPAGGSASISSFLLGFGNVDISIDVTSDEGVSAQDSATGKLLLFFLQM